MKKIIEKYYPQLLLMILAFSFFTRIYRLHIPEKYVFDEVYHAVTSKLIAENNTWAYEWNNPPPEPDTAVDWLHPPLAKYTQALSMLLLDKNSFGWRFSSAIFGVLAVFLTAKLAYNIFQKKTIALMSALIASFDGLLLTMSRIAMNDIHVTVFILMTFNFYTIYLNSKRKDYKYLVLATVSAGLATGTKWSGLFALLSIGFIEVFSLLKDFVFKLKKLKKTKKSKRSKRILKETGIFTKRTLLTGMVMLLIPPALYILSYSHMFLLGKDFNHLIEMHKNIWWYQTNLDATHPAQSRPIEWFLNTKPVWIHADWGEDSRGDIYAVGNPAVFWIGDFCLLISLVYLIYLAINAFETKQLEPNLRKISFLVFIFFSVWLPWQLSPRIMFFYHYTPAVPLLSINLAYWLFRIMKVKKYGKTAAVLLLLVLGITFVVWFPHWVGIKMPLDFKDNVYFALDSWKQG